MSEKENLTLITESEEESTAITTLTPKMQRFVHLYMTGQYTVPKLAQLLEVHPNTLWKWLKREDVSAVIQDTQQATHDMVAVQLKALTLKATNKLGELVNSPIDGVALQAVKDILDRAGHKSKQEIKIDKTVTTIEQKMKDLIDATIIDVEVEDEGS
jgi:transposase-like protein